MTAKHKLLCEAAEKAVENLNSDTSVGPGQTLDSLQNIREVVNRYIEAVEADLEREERE